VVYVLREGDRIRITEEGPFPWVRAIFIKDNLKIEGWINKKYIRLIN